VSTAPRFHLRPSSGGHVTGLADTKENRRRAEAFLKVIQGQIALGYDPDLSDGVVLNIAPFHEVTPWKVAKQYWDELCEGKYEWSTMSKRLREKGLVAGGWRLEARLRNVASWRYDDDPSGRASHRNLNAAGNA
jgi:hypothetical protein